MALLLALSTAFFLSSAIASVTYLKFLRRLTPPFRCGNRPGLIDGDGVKDAPIAGGPDSPAGVTGKISISGTIPFRRFRWTEIKSFTNAFTSDVIGRGGFSTVYIARLPDSSLAAVKLHRSGDSDRLLRAFKQELDVLIRLSDPNIVRLIGYSDRGEDGASALVFEYIPGGTLRDRLAGGEPPAPLPWSRRLSIALHVAEAVDYLHEGCELPIVHGDITAANVLLDDRRGPKLCDFGSARVGFSAAVLPAGDPIIGSPGYTDPYYLRTGIFSKKSDVYSFGVMLLELITGLPAIWDGEGGLPLAAALRGAAVVAVDPMVGGEFDEEEAAAALGLATVCVGDQPSLRPSMAEVIRVMRESLPSSISTIHLNSRGLAEM